MTLFQKFTRSIPLSTQLYALIVPAFLAAIIIMSAILSSSLREVRPFADLRLITHYEAFHVIAHLVIFGSVAILRTDVTHRVGENAVNCGDGR